MSVEQAAARQEELLGRISRAYENLLKIGRNNITAEAVRVRLSLLDGYWEKFLDGHREMSSASPVQRTELLYFTEDVYASAEEHYADNKTWMKEMLSEFEGATTPTHVAAPVPDMNPRIGNYLCARLPRIDVPSFGGAYTEWQSFADQFRTLIHDDRNLSDVQKLNFLKLRLTGGAEQLLRNIRVTAANYATAWDLLRARYENKRMIVNAHLQALTSIPALTKESASNLLRLLDDTMEAVTALKNLELPVDHWDAWLVFITASKLDPLSRREWERQTNTEVEVLTWSQLRAFLEGRVRELEAIAPKDPSVSATAPAKASATRSRSHHVVSQRPRKQCAQCKGHHFIMFCPAFRGKSIPQRKQAVAELRLCGNCLSDGHRYSDCPSTKRCQTCSGSHHTLLHERPAHPHSPVPALGTTTSTSSQASVHLTSPSQPENRVCLATARVRLRSQGGRTVVIRALLDLGSEVSFVSEKVAQDLRAARHPTNVTISGVGESDIVVAKAAVTLQLESVTSAAYQRQLYALVLPRLTAHRPKVEASTNRWTHLRGLNLADPDTGASPGIDAVFGADVYADIVLGDVRRGLPGTPVAQATRLGWILFGSVTGTAANRSRENYSFHCINATISEELRRFWELEEVPVKVAAWNKEEAECDDHFASTHSRGPDGRFTVRLPLRSSPSKAELGDSETAALACYSRLERRLARDAILANLYQDFLQEYESLGHMVRVPEQPHGVAQYYLPHHPVVKGIRPDLRLRVVFNASQRTSTGVSLNDVLHVGPRLQVDLSTVLLRWRMHRIVFSADIEKMFRQIRVHPEDQALQQIYWRPHESSPVCVFRLTTVTYGTACAPYLALRTLRQLADDERARFPFAAELIFRNTYVDDILGGGDSLETVEILRTQLCSLLESAGIKLRKWSSNAPEVLQGIPDEDRQPLRPLHDVGQAAVPTLGLHWQPDDDAFGFRATSSTRSAVTKRSILSDIARLFDPLGWLAPIVVTAKLLLQELWLIGSDWDAEPPRHLVERWTHWTLSLPTVAEIQVPRWVGWTPNTRSVEIHGFCDASERAYAAAIFIRLTEGDSTVTSRLLIAKTKVAPVRKVSLPRLELCGAALLTRLVTTVRSDLRLEAAPVHLWTDSTIVLSWLQGHPTRWKTFVANRVASIQSELPLATWRHVPTHDNPADCATRGLPPGALRAHSLWWIGPSWLARPSTAWPPQEYGTMGEVLPEARSVVHLACTEPEDWAPVQRVSTFLRLERVMAYTLRFLRRSHAPARPLSGLEIAAARVKLFRVTQRIFFQKEIHYIERQIPLSRQSPLLNLQPFFCEEGLLRVGGRLRHSELSPAEAHPVILPRNSRVTLLLVVHAHHRTLHGGTQLTTSYLRRTVWIPRARNLVRSVIHRCVTCIRHRANPIQPPMADLPTARVTPSRPFLRTGVDYAGPIDVRATKGRGHRSYKGYIAVFVCLATRAIHLEVVSDYSSEAFLAAFKRLSARRGIPAIVYSDRGTTFVGAYRQLQTQLRIAIAEGGPIAAQLANDGTEWQFIPPAAPHFGGIWEAGVRSVKHHLRRVIGNHTLTFEELSTLLAEVEACLNSRPLHALNEDPSDLAALTPGHFLIGQAIISPPEPRLTEEDTNRLTRWQQLRQMTEHLWSRWSREYLHTLQARNKWTSPLSPPSVGELVVVIDDRLPPTKWLLARITGLHPGQDGIVRVATISTSNGTLTRPLVKLCRLPAGTTATTDGQ